jgi:eukaryotic-like serine/threonine-protein kinase
MNAELPRDVIAQRYRLRSQIGRGGMGSVWLAEHTSLRTPVAIKLLDPKLATDATLRARFLREAQAAASLTSTHIVRILDHGVDADLPYIAMEFLEGESLRSRLVREHSLTATATASVFAGVVRGMARAHRAGVVHRDLKPDNIFITKDEEAGEVVKIVDFGIAKLLDDAKLTESTEAEGIETATGAMLGTPYYMSPEQLRGKKQIDARTDLWSLGVIAFECLTGKRPFNADAMGELVLVICSDPPPVPSAIASVPEGFDAWFARAVAADLEKRFQTIQEFARELCAVIAPGQSWLPTEPEVSSSPPRRLGTSSSSSPVAPGESPATAPTELAAEDPKSATDGSHAVSSVPSSRARPRKLLYLGVAVSVVAAGGGALLFSSQVDVRGESTASVSLPASPPTSVRPTSGVVVEATGSAAPAPAPASLPSAVATTVVLTLETVPTGVDVLRDGKLLGKAPDPILLDRETKELTLTLRKSGYVARDVKVTPDRSQTVEVVLTRSPKPSDGLL